MEARRLGLGCIGLNEFYASRNEAECKTKGHWGLWPPFEELLRAGTFRLKARYKNNNGLAALERTRPW